MTKPPIPWAAPELARMIRDHGWKLRGTTVIRPEESQWKGNLKVSKDTATAIRWLLKREKGEDDAIGIEMPAPPAIFVG